MLLLFADRQGNLRVLLTLRASNLSSYAGQVSLPGGKADTLTETPFETARREAFEEIGLPVDYLPSPFRVEHLCEFPSHLAVTEQGVRPCVAFLHTDGSMNANKSSSASRSPTADDGEKSGQGDAVTGESLIPNLNTSEVAAVFSCPFHRFISPRIEQTQEESPIRYRGQWNNWNGVKWRMHNFFIPKTYLGTTKRKHQEESTNRGVSGDIEESSYKVWGLTARILIDSARIAYDEDPDFEFMEGIGEEPMLQRLWNRGRLKSERQQGDKMARESVEKERKQATEDSEIEEREKKQNKL